VGKKFLTPQFFKMVIAIATSIPTTARSGPFSWILSPMSPESKICLCCGSSSNSWHVRKVSGAGVNYKLHLV